MSQFASSPSQYTRRRVCPGRPWTLLLVFALMMSLLAMLRPASATDPDLEATWRKARVAIPAVGTMQRPVIGIWQEARVRTAAAAIPARQSLPAVVYMHGCSGIGGEEEASKLFFMEQGFAVFMPDSFARPARRANCNASTLDRALAPESHDLRLAELRFAIRQVKGLPWVDRRRIFVVGYSEGGLAAARFDEADVAGIVIIGWHCQGRAPFTGVKAPESVPLLALLGGADPWYQAKPGRHCGEVFGLRDKASSVVLEGNGHEIMNSPQLGNAAQARTIILDFLAGG